MGGKSSSSSKNVNKTTTQQYDQRVAAADNGIAIGAGATVYFQPTDQGVVEEAGSLIKNSLDLLAETTKQANEAVAQNTQKLFEFLDKKTTSETATLAETALKIAIPAALGYTLIRGMVK